MSRFLVFLCKLARSSRSSALYACSFQLLLIYDVESALSVLAAAAAAVGTCCLLARGARCAQALSCRAVFYRRLDGVVGGHVDHVGRCRWVGFVE